MCCFLFLKLLFGRSRPGFELRYYDKDGCRGGARAVCSDHGPDKEGPPAGFQSSFRVANPSDIPFLKLCDNPLISVNNGL